MRRAFRLELLLFVATFFAFAYFNQGGGWNQNSRFAEVRAMAEQGVFSIDSYFVYKRTHTAQLARVPVAAGVLLRHGNPLRLAWQGEHGELFPVDGQPVKSVTDAVSLDAISCSGDVSFARGHFHPNKPPGSSFAALPGYWLLQKIERLAGRSPDDWRLLNANAWLCSALSVGLISAFGCVLFFRCATILADGHRTIALAATVVLAFGTLFFPFATLLFDHDLTAVFLLASFYAIFTFEKSPHPLRMLSGSGLAAGLAAITNYVAAVAVLFLGLYFLVKTGRRGRRLASLFAFAGGLLGPFLVICVYNQICYGSPFALSNSFQNPLFKDDGPTFLGMFGIPDPYYAFALLFSPFRGIFYSAPVLALGVYGWWIMRARWRAEAWLIAAMCGLFFLINCSFFGWHAGFSSGPRYLIPAIPFLALPMVLGFARFPKISALLAIVSIVINSLFTIVDAESPVGVGSQAMVEDRPMWTYSPLADYAWPLFATGRAWPILRQMLDDYLNDAEDDLKDLSSETRARQLESMRRDLLAGLERGDVDPFLLATFTGPVSVNPVSVCESGYYHLFAARSKPARWASFNAGELLFPESRWSLAPLLLAELVLLTLAWRAAQALTADGY